MKIISSAIILLIMFFALNTQNLTHIDLTQAKFECKNAEEIFKDFEIVPLETHKDGLLIVKSAAYYLTDKYIIGVNVFGPAYLFDRKTGAFIREISSRGKGPDEYLGLLFNKSGFDEKNNILFATNSGTVRSWKCINIETNKVESIVKKPLSGNKNEDFPAHVPWHIKDSIYVSFCNNRTGRDKTRLIVYGKNGTLIKKYPNYLEYNTDGMTSRSSFPANHGIFYDYNGRTYFKEFNYNDTVFSVSEKEMSPHIIFQLRDKQPSYYHQRNADHNKGKYFINFVYESNSTILFNFSYHTETVEILGSKEFKRGSVHTGYYDKKSKRVFISSTSDLKEPGYSISGIPVSFYPISINRNEEMITGIDPEELIKNKDKIGPKYKHIFKNIREEDNPIVIIAKLKD